MSDFDLNFDIIDDASDFYRKFWRRRFDSLGTEDWCALLRFYRVLRIRIPYAAPGSPDLDGHRSSGQSYGLSRQEAREMLNGWASNLDWYGYLGSK